MHEKRGEFAAQVKALVSADLETDGLELEAVSLTDMDQTGMEFFDPSNAFDAEGLTRLTEEIELRKKARNDIEQDTMIQIRTKNLETERQTLDIDRETGIRPARATAGSGNPPGLATGGNLARESGERAQLRGSPDPISS